MWDRGGALLGTGGEMGVLPPPRVDGASSLDMCYVPRSWPAEPPVARLPRRQCRGTAHVRRAASVETVTGTNGGCAFTPSPPGAWTLLGQSGVGVQLGDWGLRSVSLPVTPTE